MESSKKMRTAKMNADPKGQIRLVLHKLWHTGLTSAMDYCKHDKMPGDRFSPYPEELARFRITQVSNVATIYSV